MIGKGDGWERVGLSCQTPTQHKGVNNNVNYTREWS